MKFRIDVDDDNYVVNMESGTALATGTERMLALGNGIRARLVKNKEGATVVEKLMFDRDRYSEAKVSKWLEGNAANLKKSLMEVRENSPRGSFSDITCRIHRALADSDVFPKNEYGNNSAWVSWVFPEYVVVSHREQYYRVDYTEDDKGNIEFGDAVKVDMEFVVAEGAALNARIERRSRPNYDLAESSERVRLLENSFNDERQEVEIVIIEEGTNHSKRRHYPKKTIKEAAQLFAGLKMFIDHPTDEEERNRPERSVKDWVSTITESWYDEKLGAAVGRVAIHNKEFWKTLKSDKVFRENIGTSIYGAGRRRFEKIDGEVMEVVEEIVRPRTVDWVTEPGARGRITKIFESNRNPEEDQMFKTLKELKESNSALYTDILKEARDQVRAELQTEFDTKLEEAKNAAVVEALKPLQEAQENTLLAQIRAKVKELAESSKLPKSAIARFIDDFMAKFTAGKSASEKIKEVATAAGDKSDNLAESVKHVEPQVAAAIVAELKYLKEAGVAGIGAGVESGDETEKKTVGLAESMAPELLKRLGLDKENKQGAEKK